MNELTDLASQSMPQIPVGVRGEPGNSGSSRKKRNSRLEKPAARLLRVGGRLTKIHGSFFGIDLLLQQAESAKASLYAVFGSKDGLLTSVCDAECAAFQRLVWGIEFFGKSPSDFMDELADEFLKALRNPNSMIGVSMAVLLSVPVNQSRNEVPRAIESAAKTLKRYPEYLHQRVCEHSAWEVSADFEEVARGFFKAALLATLTPRLFPKEKPEKQAVLLLAIENLATEVSPTHVVGGSSARVHARK